MIVNRQSAIVNRQFFVALRDLFQKIPCQHGMLPKFFSGKVARQTMQVYRSRGDFAHYFYAAPEKDG